nr:ATP-binding protein [Dechloromonas sp.]
ELIDGWQSRGTGIEFALEQSAPLAGVNESVALTLYRIVQEALTNVVRHSAAHHCSVRITGNEQEVSLSIEDDGKGLPDAGLVERGGLLGMAERVEMAGGRLTLTGSPQGGLGITVLLPLKIREIQAMTGEAT